MIMLAHAATGPKSFVYPFPFSRVCQFRVALRDIAPEIWRRVLVPYTCTFWDLHCAITDAFGWLDCHLHRFDIPNPQTGKEERLGIPDDEVVEDVEVLAGWEKKIAVYFSQRRNPRCLYLYDFGDGWRHDVVLERSFPREPGRAYPACSEGARACPPEDVGGPDGYEQFLEAVRDPKHEGHKEWMEWCGGWFEPDWFDPVAIRFEDPDLRWDVAFQGKAAPRSMRKLQYHELRGRERP
jgi:hypothetical protein